MAIQRDGLLSIGMCGCAEGWMHKERDGWLCRAMSVYVKRCVIMQRDGDK
jgi:hypothetical protein